jgi:hypothetical protein
MRATAALLAGILLSAAGPARAQEDEPPRFTVGAALDTRFVHTGFERSWLDGGLGKARYGTLVGAEEANLARLSTAALLLDASLGEVVQAHVQLRVDAEPDAFLKRGRVGLVEAYGSWRPEFSPTTRLRLRAGMFFPPISLEHPVKGWHTAYTVTPSAVNTWIGEEIRATGAEVSLVLRPGEHEVAGTAAAFGMNDPAGALLAWRGWALHDRTTQTGDELPFAALPFFRPGGEFAQNAPWVSPIREVDGRLGWYAGGSWRWPSVLEARALRWDNRGQPDAFDQRQYAWHTRFTSLGLRLELPGPVEALGQHLWGGTGMGIAPPGLGLPVAVDYEASYVLLTGKAGRHRFTVRWDRFEAVDRDFIQDDDDNDEEGDAWTAAYLVDTGAHHRLALEWMRISSTRPMRASLRLAPELEEDLFQASFRILF